jgi:hypothetical protein
MNARITSPRRLRSHRAVQRWAEGGDLQGVPIDVIESAVADAADFLRRDLDLAEVERTCIAAIAAAVHDREQAEAEKAIASTREEERLAYLAKVRDRVLVTRDDEPRGRR